MRKVIAVAGLAALGACAPVHHGGYAGDGYYDPAPTYYSAPPAYYSPPPTYYQPPVVVRPRPVIIVQPPPRPHPRHCWWDHGRPPRQHCR